MEPTQQALKVRADDSASSRQPMEGGPGKIFQYSALCNVQLCPSSPARSFREADCSWGNRIPLYHKLLPGLKLPCLVHACWPAHPLPSSAKLRAGQRLPPGLPAPLSDCQSLRPPGRPSPALPLPLFPTLHCTLSIRVCVGSRQ